MNGEGGEGKKMGELLSPAYCREKSDGFAFLNRVFCEGFFVILAAVFSASKTKDHLLMTIDLPQTSPSEGQPPAFGCVVYLRKTGGQFSARVANLEGIEAVGASQRDVLNKIVAEFKQTVAEAVKAGGEPEWVDPPLEKQADEQKLFLPVHL